MKQILNKKQVLYILSILALIVLMGSCSRNQRSKKNNDWDKENLIGKVKSYKEISYKAIDKFGIIEKGVKERQNHYTTDIKNVFNENGYIVETYLYLLFDYFIEKNIYDENENIIEKNIIEKNIYNPDKILNRKSIHKYNDKGYILETNRYDSNGNLEFKWKFKCDEIGNITERNEYNNNGDITRKVVWIYDENKNAIGFNLYNSDGEPISKTINEFDKNNNMTKTEFSNYQNGEYIGGLTSFRSYEEGVLISETRYDIESGRTINDENYEYKFDTKGNWIEKIIYINNIPQFLIEREIEYFD